MSLNITPFVSQKTQIVDIEDAKKLYNLQKGFSFYKNTHCDNFQNCHNCGQMEPNVVYVSNALTTYTNYNRYCLDCYDNIYNAKK